ncbi:MAG: allantoicase [Gemmatimonadaceae bacterium]
MSNFHELIDLAAERLGGTVLAANDEFFAPKESLLKAAPAEWREGVYTERGKWMDGWETRRRREPGHDWAIVRLGVPGRVHGVIIDTAFFTGNYPEQASLEGCVVDGTPGVTEVLSSSTRWREILPLVPLDGDTSNRFVVHDEKRVTHLRLNIHPDGGVARLRVHGVVMPDERLFTRGSVDLAAAEHGGYVEVCSDMFYGHRQNLVMPGRSTHMGDGWETRRRRGEGNDWTIVRLAARGTLDRVELDTDHFKGNAPGACLLEYCDSAGADAEALSSPSQQWKVLIPRTSLQPHARHAFDISAAVTCATHVRLSIYPDGGVARLRLFGRVVDR